MKFYELKNAWTCPHCDADMASSIKTDYCPNCDYVEQGYP